MCFAPFRWFSESRGHCETVPGRRASCRIGILPPNRNAASVETHKTKKGIMKRGAAKTKLILYTDGGARGNPGPAAIGVVIGDKRYGERIGEATNNVAEYRAVIFALKKAKQLLGKENAATAYLEVRSDSELVVRQLRGEYRVKEESLFPLFIEVWNARQDFASVAFKEIPREENKTADSLVNEALDGRGTMQALFQ